MKQQAIVFSGHMIDMPDRETPRFPASKEQSAIRAVREAIDLLLADGGHPKGFAGGACGGDIIFHEICIEKNIPSVVLLAMDPERFVNESVKFAGEDWVARFEKICRLLQVRILPDDMPEKETELNIWERTNEWIMQSALAYSADHCSLVSIWDGKGGDGPGGTKHMVDEINSKHQKTILIDPLLLSSGKE